MTTFKLVAESGKEKGREFPIPAGDKVLKIGRSSQNDITLSDKLLSRFHCTVGMRGNELWITDLASANGTQVNGKDIDERRLEIGDIVTVGDVQLRISDAAPVVKKSDAADESGADSNESARANELLRSGSEPAQSAADIDLGLGPDKHPASFAPSAWRKSLLKTLLAGVLILFVLLVCKMIFIAVPDDAQSIPDKANIEPESKELQIFYEKTEGSDSNVFKYRMQLGADCVLRVKVDDPTQNRHIDKKSEGPVDRKLLDDLLDKIKASGFDQLDSEYIGLNPQNSWFESTAVIIIGREAKTVKIKNKIEPPQFRNMRECVETFVNTELGLWAIEYSEEKLIDLAIKDLETGQKLYSEREIRPDNLFNAIRSFKSCMTYLDTIEPKPDFYNAALAALKEAESDLEKQYKEANWQADHAISLKDWDRARKILQNLGEMIPDRADQRHEGTERRLLDVESRIRHAKK